MRGDVYYAHIMSIKKILTVHYISIDIKLQRSCMIHLTILKFHEIRLLDYLRIQ